MESGNTTAALATLAIARRKFAGAPTLKNLEIVYDRVEEEVERINMAPTLNVKDHEGWIAEIRELSRLAGLSTWDRPASACLSSRVPYGTPVTPETIETVERGEEAIRALGFRQFRVRFHGELVRIEVAPDELARALTPDMAQAFVGIFKPLGFHYVTIDLEGYRQGSLNAVLRGS